MADPGFSRRWAAKNERNWGRDMGWQFLRQEVKKSTMMFSGACSRNRTLVVFMVHHHHVTENCEM